MSDIQTDSIEVSREEERYLRSAFRRFALPYLAGIALVAGLFGALLGGDGSGVDPAELAAVQEKNASLRADLGAVVERLDSELVGAVARMSALERKAGGGESVRQLAEVREDLDAVSRRISSVEASRGAAGLEEVEERLASLEDRFQRLERARSAATSDLRRAPYPPASPGLP
jgi:acyl carrier protein phosphodiesterase